MRSGLSVLLAGIGLLAASAPAWAHHSFAAEFDENKRLTLKGTVTKMEWVNPHVWIHIDVKNPDGTITKWMVEGNTPNSLLRAGFTKRTVEAGAQIVVTGYQAKSGDKIASGSSLTFNNGKQLSLGSSRGGDANGNHPLLDWISQDEAIWRKQAAALAEASGGGQ